MTYEEAIKIIDEFGGCCSIDYEYVAAHLAIGALKKQIPKKPKCWSSDEQDIVCCPICNFEFGILENITYYNIHPLFCKNCGQAILWNEEE